MITTKANDKCFARRGHWEADLRIKIGRVLAGGWAVYRRSAEFLKIIY